MPKYTSQLVLGSGLLLAVSLATAEQTIAIPATLSFDAIPVCYNFGCKQRAEVQFSDAEKQAIRNRFNPVANSPDEERQQIRQAIGWMEVLIGRHTPTHKDIAFNLPTKNKVTADFFPGQQDCIDEAFNTTVYLKLIEQEELLKYHKVIPRAYRKAIWDQHWAGHIEELNGGKRYVIDSWFQPNGYLPVVQESKEWHDIGFLTSLVDNSSRENTNGKKQTSFWKKVVGAQ